MLIYYNGLTIAWFSTAQFQPAFFLLSQLSKQKILPNITYLEYLCVLQNVFLVIEHPIETRKGFYDYG